MVLSDPKVGDTPLFPPGHWFVVQFRRGESTGDAAVGRVEHVLSGRSARLEDFEQLKAFLLQVLCDLRGDGVNQHAVAK